MNLPVQETPFIGRVPELHAAGRLLSKHRLVTLVGAGGSGKTRLALQVAAEAGQQFPDGVFWVSLAPIRDPNVLEQAIARSVGADGELAEYLAEKKILLVLDNMEQVVAAAPVLAALLRACPSVHGLVTSREPLRITAEQRFAVAPLTSDDAVALFVDRARAVDSTFAEDESVAAICRRLDGLPLAIELAATWVNVLTPSSLLTRLERRLPLLTGGTRDMPERHQTLRATIEWSEDLLSAAERVVFHRLAIFPAGFDLSAAEAVCAADLATISSLVDKCLVRRTGDVRFALLETVHEFADECLIVSERDELAQRHGEYFVRASEAIAGAQSWPANPETFARLDDDLANVRAALTWTQSQGKNELALRLGVALSRYWIDRGHYHDAFGWLRTAPLADTSVPVSLRAAALEAAGMLDYFVAADPDQAKCYYTEGLALRRELGDGQRVAFLINRLGRIARERGDIDKALSLHGEALALFEKIADNAGRAATLHLLGETARDQGHCENAERLLKDAIRLALTSYPALLRHSLHSLGDVELDRGDYLGAAAYYQQSLDETGIHERRSRILCVAGTSSALSGLGEYRTAALLWGAVEAEELSLGFRILSDERHRYEQWAATTREHLGEPAFSASHREGEALPLDEAFSHAAPHLRTATTRGRHSNHEAVDTGSWSVEGSFARRGVLDHRISGEGRAPTRQQGGACARVPTR